jgi:hypothetical protein
MVDMVILGEGVPEKFKQAAYTPMYRALNGTSRKSREGTATLLVKTTPIVAAPC